VEDSNSGIPASNILITEYFIGVTRIERYNTVFSRKGNGGKILDKGVINPNRFISYIISKRATT
jgi:hypothetical protein